MPIVQSVDRALASRIGPGGIPDEAFGRALERTAPALAALREGHEAASLPLLRLPGSDADLPVLTATAQRLAADATDVVIIGGGPTAELWRAENAPCAVHHLGRLDGELLERTLATVPLATTRFLVIAEPGPTRDAVAQAIAVLAALDRAELRSDLDTHIAALAPADETGDGGSLRALLAPMGVEVLDLPPGIGGGYAVLGAAGLVPAALAGVDLAALRAGAARMLTPLLEGAAPAEFGPAVGAALAAAGAEAGKTNAVLMAEADPLARLALWWEDLWAASVGTDGQGTTPIAARGPAVRRVLRAGLNDKLFTLVTTDVAGTGPRIDATMASRAGEPDLGGRTIGDLVAARSRATAQMLADAGRPLRTLHLSALDAQGLGELLMHLMLEAVIAAHLFGTDPFDRTAADTAALLARRHLAESSGRGGAAER
jgi:glucose-6-phosphate isomerase